MRPDRAAVAAALARSRGALSKDSAPPLFLVLISVLVGLVVLAPLAMTVFNAAQGGFVEAAGLLWRPLVGHLLANTLGLTVVSTIACALVATASAWLVERTDLPGRRVWAIAAPLPLAIPAFVTSYAWLSVSTVFEGPLGALLVVVCSYYPLIYLPVAAALRGQDPALEESARTMGCSPWMSFLRVTLPQLKPALMGGILLVTLHVLTEFGAFALLRFRTFTTAIYTEYTAGYAINQGALLACTLLVLCLLCLFGESALRGHRSYARTGRGMRRSPVRYALGKRRWPTFIAMTALNLVTLGVPLATIGFWLSRHDVAAVTTAEVSAAALGIATLHSVLYGLLAALVTTLAALPIAFLSVRYRDRSIMLLERLAYLPKGIPGIVVALALVALSLHLLHPLYQSTALLIVAYAIMFLPLAIVSLQSTLSQVQPSLEHSARALGNRPIAVFRRIVVPLAAPGLGAAAALVFINTCTELTTTLLLVPIGVTTLATQVWAESSTFAFAATAPFAAVLVGISMLATGLLANGFGRLPIR